MARRVTVLALVVGAIPVAVYGLFAALYHGESDGDTYVKIGNSDVDAQLVGGVSLLLAAGMIAAAWLLARRRST